jgi:predicted secreted protein
MAKMSGKSGTFSYSNSTVTITQWTASQSVNQADTTGSDCYDTNSNLVHKQQIPTSSSWEISIEGPWNPTDGNTQLLAAYNAAGNGTANCSLVTITNSTFFSGVVSVSSFELTVPLEDTVTYSATLMSYGKPTIA